MSPFRFFHTILLSSCLLVPGGVRGEEFATEAVSPGWVVSDLVADGVAQRSFSRVLSNDSWIYALMGNQDTAKIDPVLGITQIIKGPPRILPSSPNVDLEGNFIFMVSIRSEWVNSVNVQYLDLDVLDLSSGTWWDRLSEVVPESYGWESKATVHNGEIRVTSGIGKILRWKVSDRTPLPTLSLPPGEFEYGERITAVFSTTVGAEFCVGVTMDDNLVFEKNGVFRRQKLSRGYLAMGAAVTTSEFIAVRLQGEGMHVWNKAKITQAPRVIDPGGWQDNRTAFWKNRFLLSVPTWVNLQKDRVLTITDLTQPASAKPLSLPMPPEFTPGRAIGIIGGHFWSQNNLTGVERLSRVPVSAGSLMLGVDVAPARAFESEGKLRFQVTADRPLTAPVTVNLQTRSGSATEGVDYVKYQGSVTLTPAKPAAEVTVTLLPDQEVESYESLILEITGVSGGAWRTRPFTTGVIEGSGFQRLKDVPAPPAFAINYYHVPEWVMTSQGVVAKSPVDQTSSGFFIYRNGGTDWERLQALGTVPTAVDRWGYRILGTRGDHLLVAMDRVPAGTSKPYTLVVLDLVTGVVVKTVDARERKAWLHSNGLIVPEGTSGAVLENHAFGDGGTDWSLPDSMYGSTFLGLNDTYFLSDSYAAGSRLMKVSDGSAAGPFPKLEPEAASDRFVLAASRAGVLNIHGVILNASGAGYPCTTFEIEYNPDEGDPGELLESGFVFCPKTYTSPASYQALDVITGAVVTTLRRDVTEGRLSASGGILAFNQQGNKVGLLDTTSRLPVVRDVQVTRTEGDTTSPWMLNLSEAAPFPIDITVSTSSADLSAKTATVTIPAGNISVPFPLSVVDDSIPESDETAAVTLTVTGNGYSRASVLTVKIPANDFRYLAKPEFATRGTSATVDPEGPAFGNSLDRVAGDVRYKKAVTLEVANSWASFGHAVGLNKKYLVVGAPYQAHPVGAKSPVLTNYVFVHERKTGKKVGQLSDTTRGSAFGSVVHVTDSWFFAGAPGITTGGVVTGQAFGKPDVKRYKHPNAKSKKTRFGTAIASKGKSVWIGAPGDGKGKVFEYDVASGKLKRTILPPAAAGGNFGQAVVVVGSRIAISAPGMVASTVFFFNAKDGKLSETLHTPFTDGGLFGASLAALDGRTLAVGCPESLFSPAGGVFLYDLPASGAKFITMLLPPKKSTKSDSSQVLQNMGMGGGLSGASGFLGVVSLGAKNLLDVTERRDEGHVVPVVAFLDISEYLPSKTKSTPASAPEPAEPVAATAWEKAMGSGATEETCKLMLDSEGPAMTLRLPQVETLAPGTRLVLERSGDLHEWVEIAVLSGDTATGWQPVGETGALQPGATSLPLVPGGDSLFYRIRCHAP